MMDLKVVPSLDGSGRLNTCNVTVEVEGIAPHVALADELGVSDQLLVLTECQPEFQHHVH